MRPLSSHPMQRFTCVLSLHSDCSRCRWHMHLTNYSYFDYGKKPKTHNLSPCQIKMTQVLGSPLFICGTDRKTKTGKLYCQKTFSPILLYKADLDRLLEDVSKKPEFRQLPENLHPCKKGWVVIKLATLAITKSQWNFNGGGGLGTQLFFWLGCSAQGAKTGS